MGNTVSKAVDFGLNVACVATGGLLGKSGEGYHFGPLRFSSDHIGIKLNTGIFSCSVKIGKNEFGHYGIDVGASVGISGVAQGSIRVGQDTEGNYGGLSCSVNAGPVKFRGSVVANSKGIRSYAAGTDGPLLSNVQYSNNGLSGGTFGIAVNENLEVNYDGINDAVAQKLGSKINDRFKQKQKKTEDESQTSEEKNGCKENNAENGTDEKAKDQSAKNTETKGTLMTKEKVSIEENNGMALQKSENKEQILKKTEDKTLTIADPLIPKTKLTSETRKIETFLDQKSDNPEKTNASVIKEKGPPYKEEKGKAVQKSEIKRQNLIKKGGKTLNTKAKKSACETRIIEEVPDRNANNSVNKCTSMPKKQTSSTQGNTIKKNENKNNFEKEEEVKLVENEPLKSNTKLNDFSLPDQRENSQLDLLVDVNLNLDSSQTNIGYCALCKGPCKY